MKRWAELVVRHKHSALYSFVAVVLLSSILGFQSFGLLKAGGYDNPNGDSTRVTELLDTKFDSQTPEVLLIADMPTLVDTEESQQIARDLQNDLKTSLVLKKSLAITPLVPRHRFEAQMARLLISLLMLKTTWFRQKLVKKSPTNSPVTMTRHNFMLQVLQPSVPTSTPRLAKISLVQN